MRQPDHFTRDLFAWLGRVARDPELGMLASRVAIVLAGYFNRKTREAWPTQQTIAGELNASERGVRKSLDELIARQHLTVNRGGFRAPNRYQFALADRNPGAGVEDADTGTPVPVSVASDRNPGSSDTGTPVPVTPEPQFLQNYRNELSKEPSNTETPSPMLFGEILEPEKPAAAKLPRIAGKKTLPADAAERFWTVYPRREGRNDPAAAEAVLAAKLKAGAPLEDILAGAKAYAATAERDGSAGTRFVSKAKNWLRDESWREQSFGPAQSTGPGRRHTTHFEQELQAMGGFHDDRDR